MKNIIVLLCVAVLLGCSSQPVQNSFSSELDTLLHKHDDKGVVFAARVIDLQSGKPLYEHRLDEPMIPASNMKLFTTAAALARFGPEYQFETFLVRCGHDLLIIGTGDPSTGDDVIAKQLGETPMTIFDQWAGALREGGLDRIKGDLLYFDGTFDRELLSPSWSKSFHTEWYAAPVAGLNFNDNCIDVTVESSGAVATTQNTSSPATLSVVPRTMNVTINNETKASAEKNDASIEREQSADVFTVKGSVKHRVELQSKPITDPGAFFVDAFRTHLQSKGIVIAGKTRRMNALPEGERVELIAVRRSPMPRVINRLNKSSQNLFAEAFCKLLGKDYNKRNGSGAAGSWEAGSKATHEFLRSQNIDDSHFVMVDGSGLSRQNKVTARMTSDLLEAMHHHTHGKVYRDSLGRAGEDGTIGKRMKDLKGHVWAKTGFIGGVRALSGYALTREGRWLAFSILFNKIPGSVKPIEELQDDACRLLVDYPSSRKPARINAATQPATIRG